MELTDQQRATLVSALERIAEGKDDTARAILRHTFNGRTGALLAGLVRQGAISRVEVGPGRLELTERGAALLSSLKTGGSARRTA